MSRLDTNKTEQKAITILRTILDGIPTATHDIHETDKGITTDGEILFYRNADTAKKENYQFRIPVQVKGRNIKSKKNSARVRLDYADLANIDKDGGAILFACDFYPDDTQAVSYLELLPYNLKQLMEVAAVERKQKVSLQLRPLLCADSAKELEPAKRLEQLAKELERICRNFHYNRSMQAKAPKIAFEGAKHLGSDGQPSPGNQFNFGSPFTFSGKLVTSDFGGDALSILRRRMEEDCYYYATDPNDVPIGILHGKLSSILVKNPRALVTNFQKTISYPIVMRLEGDNKTFEFGSSFSFDLQKEKFTYQVRGTLDQRIEALHFLLDVVKDGGFLAANQKISLAIDEPRRALLVQDLVCYQNLRDGLNFLRVRKDLNFNDWANEEIWQLEQVIASVRDGKVISIKEKGGDRICNFKLHDFYGIFIYDADGQQGILRDFLDFREYMDGILKAEVVLGDGTEGNRIFYIFGKSYYTADNLDLKSLEVYIMAQQYTSADGENLKYQANQALLAYDESGRDGLLSLAKRILDLAILYDRSNEDEYFVIQRQLMYRQFTQSPLRQPQPSSNQCAQYQTKQQPCCVFSSNAMKRLVQIKNSTSDNLLRFQCCILLESFIEAETILDELSDDDIFFDRLRHDPIYSILPTNLREKADAKFRLEGPVVPREHGNLTLSSDDV